MKNPIDEYIASFPLEVQVLLSQVRDAIKKRAPLAEEYISYGMPAYKQQGILVYFAGYKHHIGFYPGAAILDNFKEKISTYKCSKGTIQFPLDKPLPLELIAEIVQFRIIQNELKAKARKNK